MSCALPGAVAYFVRDGELLSPNPLCATGHGTSASGCPVPCGLNIPHRKEAISIDFCHIPVSIIKHSEGRSAVAAAAYANRILFLRDGAIFTEILKGGDSRRTFFNKILDVLTMMGGGVSDVL